MRWADAASAGEGGPGLLQLSSLLFNRHLFTETEPPPFPPVRGKLVVVNNRPTLIGRYGDEKQNSVLRLTSDTKVWRTLPYKLEAGRSDFSLLDVEAVSGITVNADTNSRMTKMNPGSCGTPGWRDLLNKVVGGKKVV